MWTAPVPVVRDGQMETVGTALVSELFATKFFKTKSVYAFIGLRFKKDVDTVSCINYSLHQPLTANVFVLLGFLFLFVI